MNGTAGAGAGAVAGAVKAETAAAIFGQPPHIEDMLPRASEAAAFMKVLAHEGRMMILCHLSAGEKTVTELELLLGQRQAAVSQHLARLRAEGVVSCRPRGKARLYSIADPRAAEVVGLMYRLFCAG